MTLPTVYTVTRLLKMLNEHETVMSRNKLYEELESGRLAGFKIGNGWRITEPAVLLWMGAEIERSAEREMGEAVQSSGEAPRRRGLSLIEKRNPGSLRSEGGMR